jgi:hypothetical protein
VSFQSGREGGGGGGLPHRYAPLNLCITGTKALWHCSLDRSERLIKPLKLAEGCPDKANPTHYLPKVVGVGKRRVFDEGLELIAINNLIGSHDSSSEHTTADQHRYGFHSCKAQWSFSAPGRYAGATPLAVDEVTREECIAGKMSTYFVLQFSPMKTGCATPHAAKARV